MVCLRNICINTLHKGDNDDNNNNHHNNSNYKTAVLVTAHILRKVLMEKSQEYFMGEITLHVAHIVNVEELQHSVP